MPKSTSRKTQTGKKKWRTMNASNYPYPDATIKEHKFRQKKVVFNRCLVDDPNQVKQSHAGVFHYHVTVGGAGKSSKQVGSGGASDDADEEAEEQEFSMIRGLQRDILHKIYREMPASLQQDKEILSTMIKCIGVNLGDTRDAQAFFQKAQRNDLVKDAATLKQLEYALQEVSAARR